MKFCTVDQVKALLPISSGYDGYDSLLGECATTASGLVQSFCRRQFKARDITQFFSTPENAGGNPFHLWVQDSPINSVAELRLSYSRDFDNAADLDANLGDYEIDAAKGKITLLLQTFASSRSVRVKANVGYAVDGTDATLVLVDGIIAQATAMQAGFLARRITEQSTGQTAEKDEKGPKIELTAGAAQGLLPEVKALLVPFRQPLIGVI